jgi:hypothetical protein
VSIFVLEGPDFAGKSTLARAIQASLTAAKAADQQDVVIVHMGEPTPAETADLTRHYLSSIATSRFTHTIFDRLHVGELVYGPLLRGSSALQPKDMTTIDHELLRLSATLVYVNPGENELVRRFRGRRGDALVKSEDALLSISRSYDSLIGHSSPNPWPVWDGSLPDLDFLRIHNRKRQDLLHLTEQNGNGPGGINDNLGEQC